jgi:DNA polymerase III delta prime subunit
VSETETVQPAGHSERFSTRWRLVGAGLTNVWRYGDLHLDAPSGRLLLRGPNGTGKTTALEALWPYLLDLNAQRLAAGKARPTSLALLMREGANGAKRRCGYAWLTLARPEHEGLVSYGVRLLFSETGSPAVRVTPFMVPVVPLRDVALYGPDRGFLAAEQFAEAVTGAGGTVFPDDEAYVAHLGTHIWRASDRELLELATRLRAVRNPTLLGDVSPRAAADGLRDALPGVSDDVVVATAEALAESDTTRTAFERDQEAAQTLDRFAQAWSGHVVEVTGQAYALVNEAIGEATKAERERREAAEALATAQERHAEVGEQLRAVRDRARELDATLHALEESEAYQAVGRLADLQDVVDAQNKAAAVALAAFRETVATARGRSDALRLTAEELTAELRDIAAEASAVDGSAAPAALPLAYSPRPQEAYVVGATPVDPGPRTVIDFASERVDALAASWRDLADQHRKRGDDAVLALTDRREAGEAEADAAKLAAAARTLRQQSDAEARRLAQAGADARAASDRLVGDLHTWYADHAQLAGTLDQVRGEATVSDEELSAWRPVDLSGLEVAQVLADVERLARLVKTAGESASVVLRHRGRLARQEASRLRAERDRLRTQARELRDGKLLPLPRPE